MVSGGAPALSTRSDGPLVLVLTAGMGAGHDRVGTELAKRLRAHGVRAELVDAGELLPRGWGWALTRGYKFMATRAQWSYELIFRAHMDPHRPRAGEPAKLGPLGPAAYKRFEALVRDRRPSLVVSTFHLCSQIAGEMRLRGRLRSPVVSLVLDFHVHRMWAHPGVDAHLLLHDVQVAPVIALGGRCPVVCGPVVSPAFTGASGWSRDLARQSLGLSPDKRVALVVAGSWGVGQVGRTVDAVLRAPGYVPVVVTGHNEALRRSLSERCCQVEDAMVLGWVDDMERLVAACDVLIENAGGLSAMEAMARGVPVITYRPIAGHGRANAQQMALAGVSLYPRDPQELLAYLALLCTDDASVRRIVSSAHAMLRDDPARVIAAWAKSGRVTQACPEAADSGPASVRQLGSGAPVARNDGLVQSGVARR